MKLMMGLGKGRSEAIELSDKLKNESLYRQKLEKLLESHVMSALAKIITSYIPRRDVFGIDAWQAYFGVNVRAELLLPKDIDQILQAPSHIAQEL